MALLTLQDIHRTHGERHLLRGVSLAIEPGERVGLLGINGCGKSTLLRMAAGLEAPDAGQRTARRDLRLGYLEQEPRLPQEATLRQAVLAGLAGREAVLADLARVHSELEAPDLDAAGIERLLGLQARLEDRLEQLGGHDPDHRVGALLAGVGLDDPERRCAGLSGGEARRAALARLLLSGPELLLLDEPTNHLDAEAVDWLEDQLLESRLALLMITHDRYLLDRVVDRILELELGQLVSYDGGYGDYLVARAARLEAAQRVESARANLLRRETAWMRRGPPARTTKSKARIGRYRGLVDAAPESGPGALEFSIPSGPRLGTRVLEVHGLSKRLGQRVLLDGFDLELGPGERLGILGPNGAGKTTLLRLIEGSLQPDGGSRRVGDTVVFASIDQERSGLDPAKTVLAEVAGGGGHVRLGDELRRVESFLEQFLFPGAQKLALVGKLSGGERNRVLLAKLLCLGGNVLLLDEPTNDLDLMTLRALEEALLGFPGSVLVVSHDRYFLDRVATRVLYLDGAGQAHLDACDASTLLERRAARQVRAPARGASQGPDAAAPAAAVHSGAAQAARRLSNWERSELDALPDRIEAVEARLAAIAIRLAERSLYQGPAGERRRVEGEQAEAAAELATLTARWEELEARAAGAPGA